MHNGRHSVKVIPGARLCGKLGWVRLARSPNTHDRSSHTPLNSASGSDQKLHNETHVSAAHQTGAISCHMPTVPSGGVVRPKHKLWALDSGEQSSWSIRKIDQVAAHGHHGTEFSRAREEGGEGYTSTCMFGVVRQPT